MKKRELVQFVIQNTSSFDVEFPIFQKDATILTEFIKYSWNVTSETFLCAVSFILVNGTQYNVFHSANINSLVQSLNALGFGQFYIETSGGNTFISVNDDINVYGYLWVCPLI